jgi:copper transport protein
MIHITVTDSDGTRQDVVEIGAELTLTARQLGPFAVPLHHTESGQYDASGIQLPFRGPWKLWITIRTSDIDETTVAVPIDIR